MVQDWILAAGNAVFVAVLIPSLLNRSTEMPRSTSITTSLILGTFAVTHVTMAMPWAAAMNAAGFAAWMALAILRPIRRQAPSITHNFTPEEVMVVLQWRNWREAQRVRQEMMSGELPILPSDGCNGCPSNRQ
jgi:hypothetical protein